MNKAIKRVALIGANGFVGRNLAAKLQQISSIDLCCFFRRHESAELIVDILDRFTWQHIVNLKPDIIIDATGYGIVKSQSDLQTMYSINYLEKVNLARMLFKNVPNLFWIQIGTAFEYGLEQISLKETSYCLPRTHYGISKLMFSNFLEKTVKERYCILRPFAMFGKWEDVSKLIPHLILAQKNCTLVNLSDGHQQRDYFYVEDLSTFLAYLIKQDKLPIVERRVVNIGSGCPTSLRGLSEIIAKQISDFEPKLWNWGSLPSREGEVNKFYNASLLAYELGFRPTLLETALMETVQHYFNQSTNDQLQQ